MKLPKELRKAGDEIQMAAIYNDNADLVEKTKLLLSKVSSNPNLSPQDKEEIHQFILGCIRKFSDYVSETNNYVFVIHSISELRGDYVIGQDEFERRLKNADSGRRGKHNLAIDACNQLNRQCDVYSIPRICDIDTNNRAEVADFAACFAMAAHGYALHHNYTMDEVVQKLSKDPRMLNGGTVFEKDEV